MMVQLRGTRDFHRIESRMAGAIPLCAVRQAFIVVVGNHGMMPDGWHSRWRAGEGSGKFSLFLFCPSPPYSCSVLRTIPDFLFLSFSLSFSIGSRQVIPFCIFLSLSLSRLAYIWYQPSFRSFFYSYMVSWIRVVGYCIFFQKERWKPIGKSSIFCIFLQKIKKLLLSYFSSHWKC